MMTSITLSKSIIFAIWLLVLSPGNDAVYRSKYRHFDDYLTHLDRRRQSLAITEKPEAEGSGEVEGLQQDSPKPEDDLIFSRPLPIRTGAIRSKEVSCCMLGQLAGEKGYHCHVKFYAARLMARNYNRAHNKKIAGLQPRYAGSPAQRSSDKLMRTFQQCVTTSRGVLFHKCCQLEAMERDPIKSAALRETKRDNRYTKRQ